MYFKDSSAVGFCTALLLVALITCWINAEGGEALGTFGFDVHHRYSDTVREYLDVDGLPEKDSLDYFAAMAHRDELFKARRLATTPSSGALLTFLASNRTIRFSSLGFLHYAVVVVGTPPVTFLVALDTGSDLFWLPCDCTTCLRRVNITSGTGSEPLDLNIYSPRASSTASPVSCTSPMCGSRRQCSASLNACSYKEVYLSANTSTTGILVDDVLHLGTESSPQDLVNVPITLGCGMIQTGDFVENAAINGLFGLGMDNVSVPSILANKGLTANSFSMCFGISDGLGRIEFGDKGSPDQKVTSFNLESRHPTYNVTVTQIAVENNITDIEFTPLFDSGTSFTYLNDPAYSLIADGFNSQITNEPRYQPPRKIIFDYCYAISATQESINVPSLNFTMKGGDQYAVKAPIIVIPRQGGYAYCLAVVRSNDVNIIGQNFMAGYRIVFDREEMVMGWKESDCSSLQGGTRLPVNESNSTGAPAPSVFNPQETPTGSPQETPTGSDSPITPRVLSPPPPSPPTGLLVGSGAEAISHYKASSLVMLIVSLLCFYQLFIFFLLESL